MPSGDMLQTIVLLCVNVMWLCPYRLGYNAHSVLFWSRQEDTSWKTKLSDVLSKTWSDQPNTLSGGLCKEKALFSLTAPPLSRTQKPKQTHRWDKTHSFTPRFTPLFKKLNGVDYIRSTTEEHVWLWACSGEVLQLVNKSFGWQIRISRSPQSCLIHLS